MLDDVKELPEYELFSRARTYREWRAGYCSMFLAFFRSLTKPRRMMKALAPFRMKFMGSARSALDYALPRRSIEQAREMTSNLWLESLNVQEIIHNCDVPKRTRWELEKINESAQVLMEIAEQITAVGDLSGVDYELVQRGRLLEKEINHVREVAHRPNFASEKIPESLREYLEGKRLELGPEP